MCAAVHGMVFRNRLDVDKIIEFSLEQGIDFACSVLEEGRDSWWQVQDRVLRSQWHIPTKQNPAPPPPKEVQYNENTSYHKLHPSAWLFFY